MSASSGSDDDVVIAPAQPTDLADVERLALAVAPDTLGRAFGNRPEHECVAVLVSLRAARPDATAGTLVARTRSGDFVGFARYTPRPTATVPVRRRLRALRPLGPVGAARFVVVGALAFAHYRAGPGEAYLSGLAVDPAFRRRGIGERLARAREEAAAALGYRILTAIVAADNTPMRSLLRNLGYSELPPRRLRLIDRVLRRAPLVLLQKRG